MNAKVVLKCPNCDANVPYNGTDRLCVCEYCGTQIEPDLRPKTKDELEYEFRDREAERDFEKYKESLFWKRKLQARELKRQDFEQKKDMFIRIIFFIIIASLLGFIVWGYRNDPSIFEEQKLVAPNGRGNRNGFDMETNNKIESDLFTIFYPSYYETVDDSGSHFQFAPAGEKTNAVHLTIDYITGSPELDINTEEGMDFVKERFGDSKELKMDLCEKRSYGRLSGVWIHRRIRKTLLTEGGVDQYVYVAYPDGYPEDILAFILTQADTSRFNYTEDFISIIKNISYK